MNPIDTLYRWLSGDDSPAANEVLGAALEHAEPEYAERITKILLHHKHEMAWAGLIAKQDRLSAEARARLTAQPERLRAGLAHVLQHGTARARLNALTIMEGDVHPQLTELVVAALRDSAPEIVNAAAAALRATAIRRLAEAPYPRRIDVTRVPPDCAALGVGLRDALRTFDVHRRLDVVETCLWCAKFIGPDLWQALGSPGTRLSVLVAQSLWDWNHPRLAGFLLSALGRPAWRQNAAALLEKWSTQAELLAILQNSDLLADPAVRRGVASMNLPDWFSAVGPTLASLPLAAQALVPHWVSALPFNDTARLRLLIRWQGAHPGLQRASAYALARLGTGEAIHVLESIAARPGPLRSFARWYVAGRRSADREAQYARGAGLVGGGKRG